ncbi:MAG: enoyl-CoA hydratase-related protein [Phenylobacterium sp.]
MVNEITSKFVQGVDAGPEGLVQLDDTQEGVVVVTLNRPARKNAFDDELIAAMSQAFETLRAADGVRVVFLRGAGGAFSAGADLEWMQRASGYTEAENRQDAMVMANMLKALWDIPALTCALVEGPAFGGGAGLVAACDLAVATEAARFSFSEVRLGLIPAVISPYVVAAIGPRAARGLFATGREISARYAAQIGLITEAVANSDELDKAMERIAEAAVACAPGAVAASKQLVADIWGRDIDHGLLELTARRIAAARVSEEGQEGVRAFLERRRPSWAG